MWIETRSTSTARRHELRRDECGAIFDGASEDRRAGWHRATIAGWARTARGPERHICDDC